MNIHEIRKAIPALDRYIHANAAGISPTPQVVTDEILRLYRLIGEHGYIVQAARSEIDASATAARVQFAQLFNVTPQEIVFVRNVSEGVGMIAYGFDWREGDEVIITDQENPSCYLPWLNLAKRRGIRVRKLRLFSDQDPLSQLRSLLTHRTRLIAISHVTSDFGICLPARQICEIAHAQSVPVLFDGAQAAGQIPTDLQQIGCDFYVTNGYKWLLGPRGTGALYIQREWHGRLEVSWTGEGADKRLDYETDKFEFWDNYRKFEFGSRHSPLYGALGRSVEFLRSVGLEVIEERCRKLASKLKAGLIEMDGIRLLTPVEVSRSAGAVTFVIDGHKGSDVASKLINEWGIICRATPHNGIRLSMAFFLTEEEVDVALGVIQRMNSIRSGQR